MITWSGTHPIGAPCPCSSGAIPAMWNPPIVTPWSHHDGAFSGDPKIAVSRALTGPNRIE